MLMLEVRITIRDQDEYGLAHPIADVTRRELTAIPLDPAREEDADRALAGMMIAARERVLTSLADAAEARSTAAAERDLRHYDDVAKLADRRPADAAPGAGGDAA